MIWNLKIDVRCNACHRKFYAPRHNSQQRTDPSALNDAEPDSIINRVDEFQMSCTNAWCSFCVSYIREEIAIFSEVSQVIIFFRRQVNVCKQTGSECLRGKFVRNFKHCEMLPKTLLQLLVLIFLLGLCTRLMLNWSIDSKRFWENIKAFSIKVFRFSKL